MALVGEAECLRAARRDAVRLRGHAVGAERSWLPGKPYQQTLVVLLRGPDSDLPRGAHCTGFGEPEQRRGAFTRAGTRARTETRKPNENRGHERRRTDHSYPFYFP